MAKATRELVELENLVVNELLVNGYPKNSIVLEWKLDVRRYVDLVVIDVETGIPLMMIEIKSCSNRTQDAVTQMIFNRLKEYYEKSDIPIKAVAAILHKDENSITFIDFTDAIKENDISLIIRNYKFPPYKTLALGAQRKALSQQKEKQERKIAVLKILCWIIIPLVCLGLILLDAFSIYTFSNLRLIAVGACIAIILIPCFKEIKIGEITIKNQIDKIEEKDS